MSVANIEPNWIHRFRKLSNWIFSYFVISLHWISFMFRIPRFQEYIEDIRFNGLQILNLKIHKALHRDLPRQFLHIAITIISVRLHISLYARDGFYVQRNLKRFPKEEI